MKKPDLDEVVDRFCKNSTKKALKVAKKPVLREKCGTASPSQKLSHGKGRGDPARFGEEVHRWTSAEALAASRKGNSMKAVRAAILNDCTALVAKEGKIQELFSKAIEMFDKDPEKASLMMNIAERASKFIGATFDQSPDAKQKIEVDGKMDNTLEVKISEA